MRSQCKHYSAQFEDGSTAVVAPPSKKQKTKIKQVTDVELKLEPDEKGAEGVSSELNNLCRWLWSVGSAPNLPLVCSWSAIATLCQ